MATALHVLLRAWARNCCGDKIDVVRDLINNARDKHQFALVIGENVFVQRTDNICRVKEISLLWIADQEHVLLVSKSICDTLQRFVIEDGERDGLAFVQHALACRHDSCLHARLVEAKKTHQLNVISAGTRAKGDICFFKERMDCLACKVRHASVPKGYQRIVHIR